MDQIAGTIADQLEKYAGKVRAMTVDRARSMITSISIGITAATLAVFAVVILAKGLFRLLAVAVTEAGAYGIVGGIIVAAGAFIWSRRDHTS